jgi:hypothetical protein
MRRRFVSIAAVGLGAVLLAGSGAVRVWAAPALVRFPLNVDETTQYTGTALTYVDQATLLPFAQPKSEPVSISRHVKVVSGTFDRAVIDETVTVKTPSTTSVEQYQYVIDRRSMKMVADPRQYAFGNPAAVMHAAGAYRVNFAMGTNTKGSYLAYIPEADVTAPLVLVEGPHYHSDARATVLDFSTKVDKPVAPYYLAHLKAMGLPMQVTAAQLQPLLLADGIDVSRALADVGPRLTPAESRLVTQTLAKSVPLRYFFVDNGLVSIEPKTGALIDVHAQQQGVAVAPDLTGAATLQPLLAKYAAIPSVKALSTGLAALAARPPQLAQSYKWTQTVPSSLESASDARAHARTMNLIEVWVPWAMAILGLLLLGFGLVGLLGGRRKDSSVSAGETQPALSTEPVSTEPVPTEPVPTEPVSTGPVPSEPVSTEPVTTPAAPARTYEGV